MTTKKNARKSTQRCSSLTVLPVRLVLTVLPVLTVLTVSTLLTEFTVLIVLILLAALSVFIIFTEDLKRYHSQPTDSVTDNLKSRDASASKNCSFRG